MKLRNKLQKILLIFSLISILLLTGSSFCFSQEGKPLEVEYPNIPGISEEEIPTTTKTALPDYIKYVFNFFIAISGLIIFLALVLGGIRYLTSMGNPATISDVKDQIFSDFIGLIIVLSSYIILTTINPQLVVFSISKEDIPEIQMPEVPKIEEKGSVSCLQIPTGVLIERALLDSTAQTRLTLIKEKTEEAEKKAKDFKELNEELKNLTLSCQCGSSECGGENCQGFGCPNAFCDKEAIKSKIEEIKLSIEDLENFQKELRSLRWDFNEHRQDLRMAAILMTGGCEEPVITQNEMIGIKEKVLETKESEILTFPDWPSNKISYEGHIISDPITFYCEHPDFTIVQQEALTTEISETLEPEDYPFIPSNPLPTTTAPPPGSTDFKLTNFPNLRQTDSKNYAVKFSGCGPTSLTTVMRYYGWSDMTPEKLAYELQGAGAWSYDKGLYHSAARNYLQSKYGLFSTTLSKNPQVIKDNLLTGKPVVISCRFPPYNKYGHIMVIYGLNYLDGTVNKFYIVNPWKNYLKEITPQHLNYCTTFYSF